MSPRRGYPIVDAQPLGISGKSPGPSRPLSAKNRSRPSSAGTTTNPDVPDSAEIKSTTTGTGTGITAGVGSIMMARLGVPFAPYVPGVLKLHGVRQNLDRCRIEQIALRRLRYVIENNDAEPQHLAMVDLLEQGNVTPELIQRYFGPKYKLIRDVRVLLLQAIDRTKRHRMRSQIYEQLTSKAWITGDERGGSAATEYGRASSPMPESQYEQPASQQLFSTRPKATTPNDVLEVLEQVETSQEARRRRKKLDIKDSSHLLRELNRSYGLQGMGMGTTLLKTAVASGPTVPRSSVAAAAAAAAAAASTSKNRTSMNTRSSRSRRQSPTARAQTAPAGLSPSSTSSRHIASGWIPHSRVQTDTAASISASPYVGLEIAATAVGSSRAASPSVSTRPNNKRHTAFMATTATGVKPRTAPSQQGNRMSSKPRPTTTATTSSMRYVLTSHGSAKLSVQTEILDTTPRPHLSQTVGVSNRIQLIHGGGGAGGGAGGGGVGMEIALTAAGNVIPAMRVAPTLEEVEALTRDPVYYTQGEYVQMMKQRRGNTVDSLMLDDGGDGLFVGAR
ncbi:hypothetical protein HK102_010668 [Quaeritorhiza haematococci]|nr:hypothetical protein HK102_010668 [Quaeritorhiza haematococci]